MLFCYSGINDNIATSSSGHGAEPSLTHPMISSTTETTDPNAACDTQIRFLNQTSTSNNIPSGIARDYQHTRDTARDYETYRFKEHQTGAVCKLAHVNVTVPSLRNYGSGPTFTQASMGRSYPPVTRSSSHTATSQGSSGTVDANTTFTMSAGTTDTAGSRKIKKISQRDVNSGGLIVLTRG